MKRFLCALLVALAACTNTAEKPVPNTPSPGAHWTALPDAPEPRQEVAAALVGKEAFIAGGLTASGATALVESFNIEGRVWRPAKSLPHPLHHAMAASVGGALIVGGGFDSHNKPQNSVYRLLPGSAWTVMPHLNRPRAAGAFVVANGILYAVGGQTTGGPVGPIEKLAGNTWVDLAPIPTPRHHCGVATDGNSIWVAGGRVPTPSGGGDHNVDAFERYDISSNRWTRLGALPTSRSGHAAAHIVVSGRAAIVVAGGEDPRDPGSPAIESVLSYDIASSKWSSKLPAMFRPRHGVGVVVAGNAMYVFLGGSRAGVAPTVVSDVLSFS